MAINAFSNFIITISDGNTVPSFGYLSSNTYVNIGSGTVFKISWDTPTAASNAVDYYKVYIQAYDSISASYNFLYKASIGNVNEFYVNASLFEQLQSSFVPLYVYVEAVSKYGSQYNATSNLEHVNVGRGCGTYIKAKNDYSQPTMKRAIAFAKLDHLVIHDKNGKVIMDADGEELGGKASSLQDDATGWTLMQEFFSELPQGVASLETGNLGITDSNEEPAWVQSDIRYEVLTNKQGDVITDINGDCIYVL